MTDAAASSKRYHGGALPEPVGEWPPRADEYRTRPCGGERVCPWRADADLTAFSVEDMLRLQRAQQGVMRRTDSTEADVARLNRAPRMACHKDQPDTAHPMRLCAGLAGRGRPRPHRRAAQHHRRHFARRSRRSRHPRLARPAHLPRPAARSPPGATGRPRPCRSRQMTAVASAPPAPPNVAVAVRGRVCGWQRPGLRCSCQWPCSR